MTDNKINKEDIESYYKTYDYNSRRPVFIELEMLDSKQEELLMRSDTFCIYPWTHIHAWPDGYVYPCCGTDINPLGTLKENTLEELWNSEKQKQLRLDMLNGTKNEICRRCHEQEESGFFSMRNSANKHLGHHIERVSKTQPDGSYDDFNIVYWDVRFSNLCNFRCRSCGPNFSSNWFDDAVKINGGKPIGQKKVIYAGKDKEDVWEQMKPHIPYLEQVYFAGGEPMIMEEHYRVLKELVRLEKFDVKLIYNTNFSMMKYKDLDVLEFWKLFDSVSVGASLDAAGPRAELIRKGTDWDQACRNRERMLKICPGVDFYVSPTLSLMNSLHVPDFHREWIDRGFLRHLDLNINILQGPNYYRIDALTPDLKQQVKEKYLEHIDYIEPHDPLTRATNGFKSAIQFMEANDNTPLLPEFNRVMTRLDGIRDESFYNVFPELKELEQYVR